MSLPRVLCVDDEPNVLDGLKRTLRGRFDVTTAGGAAVALERVAGDPPFAIAVSDLRMPEIDGVQLLRHLHERCPDTVRILLTGHADVPAAIAAINEGRIFRFLTKPCPPELLISVLTGAAEQHRLVTAERVLLEQTLRGSIQALADVVGIVHPAVVGRASRIRRLMSELATKLGQRDLWPLEVSALLAHLGYITLPAHTVEKLHSGAALGIDEQDLVSQVPEVAARLVATIPRLEPVREILLHENARFDGAGAAAGSPRGEAIPIGARLLKLANDYDLLESQGISPAAVVRELAGRTGWYDPALIAALRDLSGSHEAADEVQVIPLADVRIGMVFAGDVKNPSGLLLVARGQEVTESLLGRVRNYWQGFARTLKVSVIEKAEPAAGDRRAA